MPVKPDATLPVPLAPGLSGVAPSLIRRIADVAFGMGDVLKLHFGESDQPTPDFIKDAAVRALAEGFTYYTANAGLPTLRAAIADTTATLHGVRLDPQREVLVTASGVQALNVAIRCTLDPGDEAIVLTPNWPNASSIVALYGGRAREVPLRWSGERYTVDPEALAAALGPRTRLLVYASPSNPLGWVARAAEQDSPPRVLPPQRAVAPGRRGLRAHLFRRPGRALHPAPLHARRRRHRGAVIFEELLHDGLAPGLVDGARRPGRPSRPAERVHRLARAVHGAARRRNGAAPGRGLRAGNAGAGCPAGGGLPPPPAVDPGGVRGAAGRLVLPLSRASRGSSTRSPSPSPCSRKGAWRSLRGRRSAAAARGRCASAARRTSRFWSRPWSAWRSSSRAATGAEAAAAARRRAAAPIAPHAE